MSTSRLAYWRKRRGLSQQQLAALVGATQAAVSQMERAQRAPKGLYTALKLAAALDVTVTTIWPDAAPVVGTRSPTPSPTPRLQKLAVAGGAVRRGTAKSAGRAKR